MEQGTNTVLVRWLEGIVAIVGDIEGRGKTHYEALRNAMNKRRSLGLPRVWLV